MINIDGKIQNQSLKDDIISDYIKHFLKSDYCFWDKKTNGRNLMWCNLKKERDNVIPTEELAKIRIQNEGDLFFYLERTEELYEIRFEEICRYINSLEPWEEIDAVIFDKTMEWMIAVTHEDFSIIIGL